MRIRLLSERDGHAVGTELEVSSKDPKVKAWLANEDAERVAEAVVQTSAQVDPVAPVGGADLVEAAAAADGPETAMQKKAEGR